MNWAYRIRTNPINTPIPIANPLAAMYCACVQKMSGEDDYPLNRVADHLSSQFYDGDGSVELIRKYGKERQEYMASAFEYFAQNT